MKVFGGREQYLEASEREIQEQTQVWIADMKAESERKERERKEMAAH